MWRCALIVLGADVGVVPGDHVDAAVAHDLQAFLDGPRRAGRFDDDVRPAPVGRRQDRLAPLLGQLRQGIDGVGPHRGCQRPAIGGIADRADPVRAGDAGQRDDAQADRADALDEHARARAGRRPARWRAPP